MLNISVRNRVMTLKVLLLSESRTPSAHQKAGRFAKTVSSLKNQRIFCKLRFELVANHAYWDIFSANRGNVLYNRRRACFPVGAVAPHAGAWIETANRIHYRVMFVSLPTRERGSKLA